MTSQLKTRLGVALEFLEAAIHSILYVRKIYPSSIFILRRKYNIPIKIANHPKITEYVTECLKSVKHLLELNSIRHVTMVLSSNKPIEKHVFEFLDGCGSNDPYLVEAEERFRQYLLKMSVSEATLPKLPANCTFTIEIGTTSQSSVRLSESLTQSHFPWLELENEENETSKSEIIPIHTLETQALAVQMYIKYFIN